MNKINVLLILGIVVFCVAMLPLFFSKYTEFTVYRGVDFATGEDIVEQRSREGALLDRQRRRGHIYALYRKYNLASPEELLYVNSIARYRLEYFKVFTDGQGWRFWKYEYHILRARDFERGSAYSPLSLFPLILRTFEVSEAEAQAMFERCLLLNREKNADFEIENYLIERYKHYEEPVMRKVLGDWFSGRKEDFWRELNARRFLLEHRSDYPERLPREIYRFPYGSHDLGYFFREEYILYPTELNAYAAAFYNAEAVKMEMLSRRFQEAGVLERFLKTVMPADLLPGLVSPREFMQRNVQLRFIENSIMLREHFEMRLKQLTEEER